MKGFAFQQGRVPRAPKHATLGGRRKSESLGASQPNAATIDATEPLSGGA
jgi:hypothetical protein